MEPTSFRIPLGGLFSSSAARYARRTVPAFREIQPFCMAIPNAVPSCLGNKSGAGLNRTPACFEEQISVSPSFNCEGNPPPDLAPQARGAPAAFPYDWLGADIARQFVEESSAPPCQEPTLQDRCNLRRLVDIFQSSACLLLRGVQFPGEVNLE